MFRNDSEQKRTEPESQSPNNGGSTNGRRCQPTAKSVFNLARRHWLKGKRINIVDIANDAGVSRISVYRWFGNRDQLIEDILWSFSGPEFQKIIRKTPGAGVEHIVNVHRTFMIDMAGFEPFRQFIIDNPAYIISHSKTAPKPDRSSYSRHIRAVEAHLLDQAAQGHLKPPISASKLAETIVYTNAALFYSAILGGHSLSVIELACAIDRLILTRGIPNDPTVWDMGTIRVKS